MVATSAHSGAVGAATPVAAGAASGGGAAQLQQPQTADGKPPAHPQPQHLPPKPTGAPAPHGAPATTRVCMVPHPDARGHSSSVNGSLILPTDGAGTGIGGPAALRSGDSVKPVPALTHHRSTYDHESSSGSHVTMQPPAAVASAAAPAAAPAVQVAAASAPQPVSSPAAQAAAPTMPSSARSASPLNTATSALAAASQTASPANTLAPRPALTVLGMLGAGRQTSGGSVGSRGSDTSRSSASDGPAGSGGSGAKVVRSASFGVRDMPSLIAAPAGAALPGGATGGAAPTAAVGDSIVAQPPLPPSDGLIATRRARSAGDTQPVASADATSSTTGAGAVPAVGRATTQGSATGAVSAALLASADTAAAATAAVGCLPLPLAAPTGDTSSDPPAAGSASTILERGSGILRAAVTGSARGSLKIVRALSPRSTTPVPAGSPATGKVVATSGADAPPTVL